MAKEVVFRDDDIGFAHTAHKGEIVMDYDFITKKFIDIDQLFIKYGVKHTIAVIAKDIDKATELVEYIKDHPHIDVQLHCWTHDDFTELTQTEIFDQLKKGKQILKEAFGKDVKIFYPPYNKVNDLVVRTAETLGLKTSFLKMSLQNYLNGYTNDVINFHYWADECKDLENALKKYTNNA